MEAAKQVSLDGTKLDMDSIDGDAVAIIIAGKVDILSRVFSDSVLIQS